jgi:hypothetical protein
MSRNLAPALLALALAACNAAEAQPAPTTQTAQKTSTGSSDYDLCVAVMQHARTCTDQFIPTLVDARATADVPAGIKAEVAKDRDGVIAQAKTEWSSDGTDANIEKMCQKPMPNADAERDAATACNAKTDCGEFASCIVPIEARSFGH